MGQDPTHLPVVDGAPEHTGEGTQEGEEQEQEKRQDQRQCLELAPPLRPFQAALERHLGRRIGAGKERSRHRLSLFISRSLTRSKERREEEHRRSKCQSFACTPSPTALRSRGQSAASVAEAFARGLLQHRLAGVERTWERYFVAHLLKRSV